MTAILVFFVKIMLNMLQKIKTELRLMGYCATGLIVKYFSLWYR